MLDGIKNTYFWRKNVMILSLCTQRSYGRHNVSRLFVRSFVWFDSLRPINNLSVIKGRIFHYFFECPLYINKRNNLFINLDRLQIMMLPLHYWLPDLIIMMRI